MMRVASTTLLLTIIGMFGGMQYAIATECRVTRVVDADTVICDNNRIRLSDIDAPEKKQKFGKDATECLGGLILNQTIKYDSHKKDQYGRVVARCYVNGVDISHYMVKYGCAWAYMTKDKTILGAQQEARDNKIGLWSQDKPIPPWQYRRGYR